MASDVQNYLKYYLTFRITLSAQNIEATKEAAVGERMSSGFEYNRSRVQNPGSTVPSTKLITDNIIELSKCCHGRKVVEG